MSIFVVVSDNEAYLPGAAMHVYLTIGQVPELSGLTKIQRRLVCRGAAVILPYLRQFIEEHRDEISQAA